LQETFVRPLYLARRVLEQERRQRGRKLCGRGSTRLSSRTASSLAIAIAGLNSIRHTLDSLMRLAGYNRPIGSVNVAVQGTLTCQMVEKKYAFVFRMRRTADGVPRGEKRARHALSLPVAIRIIRGGGRCARDCRARR